MATSGERSGSGSVGSAAAAANIRTAFQTFTTSTAATTIIGIPAGTTWVGTVSINVNCMINAAATGPGQATGTLSIAGVGATPAAGNVFQVSCRTGANAAGGTSSSQAANSASIPLQVTAPAGNSLAIQVAAALAGNASEMDCTCVGALQ